MHEKIRNLFNSIGFSLSLLDVFYFFKKSLFRLNNGLLKRKYYKENPDIKKLQIGCGTNVIEGWLNSDLIPKNFKCIYLDASKKFRFPDSTFDYIFSEHIFEHLTYKQGMNMLSESFRVLKKGGTIRIATPNLKFLIELYDTDKTQVQKDYVKWATDLWIPYINNELGIYYESFVINNFFRDWGHQVIYDFKSIKILLEKSGFSDVILCDVSKSSHPGLNNVENHTSIIPEDFNLLETLVVEAVK